MKIKTLLTAGTALGAMSPVEQSMGRYMRAPDGHPEPDAFAEAFAAAAASDKDGVGEDPAPAPTETPPAETPPAETPPAETPPAETPPAETPQAPAAETPPAETPPAPAAADIVAQLTEALKNNQPAPAPAAEPAPVQQPQAPIYSEQEMEVLADYQKNWPDVAAAETLKRRAEYHDLLAFVFKEVHKYVQPHLDQIGALGNIAHEQQLRAVVPDYNANLEAEVAQWVDQQPAYLQGAMKQVMQSGTSEEVADLIGRYRAASGAQQAPAPAPAAGVPKAPAAAPTTELSSAAKQAAESLAPVSGDRSAVPQGEDPMDFVSAFQRYAAAGV